MKNVLIIDDDSLVLDTLKELLKDLGYSVFAVNSLPQAKKLCSDMKFDVAICDLYITQEQAGKFDLTAGMETIIQLTSEFPALPIIAMSGGLPPNPYETLKRVGAQAAIAKPFTQLELLQKIESVTGNTELLSQAN